MSAAAETNTPRLLVWAESHPSVLRGPDPSGKHGHALAGSYGLAHGSTR